MARGTAGFHIPRMRVHESGPDTAESIVFLHGVASSAAMWNGHVNRLRSYHCLRPDFPGFGDSAGEPWVSIEDVAGQVAELIRAGVGRAHVVGLSLGGLVALSLLADAPELVNRAIVDGSSALPIFGQPAVKLAIRVGAPVVKARLVVEMIGRWIGVPDAEMDVLRNDYRRMSGAAFTNACLDALDFRRPPGIEAVQCPTLLVAGGRERGSVRSSNRLLARLMPNAKGYVVPGKPHSWVSGNQHLHCRMVEAWIEDRPLPAELVAVAP